jgi:hypothetical protein
MILIISASQAGSGQPVAGKLDQIFLKPHTFGQGLPAPAPNAF